MGSSDPELSSVWSAFCSGRGDHRNIGSPLQLDSSWSELQTQLSCGSQTSNVGMRISTLIADHSGSSSSYLTGDMRNMIAARRVANPPVTTQSYAPPSNHQSNQGSLSGTYSLPQYFSKAETGSRLGSVGAGESVQGHTSQKYSSLGVSANSSGLPALMLPPSPSSSTKSLQPSLPPLQHLSQHNTGLLSQMLQQQDAPQSKFAECQAPGASFISSTGLETIQGSYLQLASLLQQSSAPGSTLSALLEHANSNNNSSNASQMDATVGLFNPDQLPRTGMATLSGTPSSTSNGVAGSPLEQLHLGDLRLARQGSLTSRGSADGSPLMELRRTKSMLAPQVGLGKASPREDPLEALQRQLRQIQQGDVSSGDLAARTGVHGLSFLTRPDSRKRTGGMSPDHDVFSKKRQVSPEHEKLSPPSRGECGATSLDSLDLDMLPENSVLCKARAKRGCATHPRSIAERVRRTRISENMKKLQDLVPNLDKQANTADMLDEAVEYMKYLKHQVQILSNGPAIQDPSMCRSLELGSSKSKEEDTGDDLDDFE